MKYFTKIQLFGITFLKSCNFSGLHSLKVEKCIRNFSISEKMERNGRSDLLLRCRRHKKRDLFAGDPFSALLNSS
jgi:hypothetical protein